jgi:hypothetical protein
MTGIEFSGGNGLGDALARGVGVGVGVGVGLGEVEGEGLGEVTGDGVGLVEAVPSKSHEANKRNAATTNRPE